MTNLNDYLKRAYREEFISTAEIVARMLLRSAPRRLWYRLTGSLEAHRRAERLMELMEKRP